MLILDTLTQLTDLQASGDVLADGILNTANSKLSEVAVTIRLAVSVALLGFIGYVAIAKRTAAKIIGAIFLSGIVLWAVFGGTENMKVRMDQELAADPVTVSTQRTA